MPKTKIIATLGPASGSYTVLRKMVAAGLDVVRLNFSHGKHEQHLERIKIIRLINKKYKRRIRIMQDLEGFRVRVGRFKGHKTRILEKRSVFWLTNDSQAHGPKMIPLDYGQDLRWIKPGQLIYIDDGKIALRAKESHAGSIKALVLEGGILRERKGINIPDAKLEFEGITEKDKKDIEFGIKYKVDYIALSFVRDGNDVLKASELIKPRLPKCRIVAKIETRQAIENRRGPGWTPVPP